MKMKLAALVVAGVAVAPLACFAQSAPAPVNQTGPGMTPPVSTSTDMGIAGESGNTQAASGSIYATGPRAAVVTPGYGSYAAVPNSGYHRAPAYETSGGRVVGSEWANRAHYTVPGSAPAVGPGGYLEQELSALMTGR